MVGKMALFFNIIWALNKVINNYLSIVKVVHMSECGCG